MQIDAFQKLIEDTYLERDAKRGVPTTFMWFAEEVGELSEAIRSGDREAMLEEFADVQAWLVSLASQMGIRMTEAVEAKYGDGCPKCHSVPCGCPER
jgi:NTP pyrophosphatase (non-canonical NTP hydrolase)